MKKINIIGLSFLLMLSTFFTSCESWIDPTINEDPNGPVTVNYDLITPSVQSVMAYHIAGNNSVRTIGIWMQQFDGVDRQSYAEATFVYTPADCNNLWNTMYPNMNDINDIIAQASVANDAGVELSPKTRGMARVMFAQSLGFVTNLWGDVPYSEALLGDENTNPNLDSQESIFVEIQAMLDLAIVDLQDETGIVGIGTDLIFDGDAKAWLATAYGLKARYALMLSQRNGASAYATAITNANLAIATAAGTEFVTQLGFNADIFIDSPSGASPLYQFMDERSGDLTMCSTLMSFLSTNSDPRIDEYGNGDGGGTGSIPTTKMGGVDLPGDYVAAYDATSRFMNYSELYFILAEAKFSTAPAAAIVDLNTAIGISLDEAGVSTTAAFDTYLGGLSTLEDIMTEKWVSTFGTIQAFNDWRRTDFPVLTLPVNATTSEIARRLPYSQEEVTYNSNVPGDAAITDHVWWDL